MAKVQSSTKDRVHLFSRTHTPTTERISLIYRIGGKQKFESTGEFKFIKPKDVFEREHNKAVDIKLTALKNKRESELFSGEIDKIIEKKAIKNQIFLDCFQSYVDNYTKNDLRVFKAVLAQLKVFIGNDILTANQIDKDFCIRFKEHLSSKLNGESSHTYFARFKKFIEWASDEDNKQRIFDRNPAKKVENTKEDSKEKEILTIEELTKLIATECGNVTVKNAFLFASFSGLGYSELTKLTWEEIKPTTIEYKRAKTGKLVKVPLTDNARLFLPERGQEHELVFKLPTTNGTNKTIKNWVKRAGIDKHITSYCSRHTFGTLQAFYSKGDLLTISKNMGHSSTKYTVRYIRTSEEMKARVLNSIPDLIIEN